jgi:molybdate transport system substrate-binding protein
MRWLPGLLLLLASCSGEKEAVRVFAASSLREVVQEVAGEWSRRNGVEVRLQFDASSTLARQIEAGAPADLFISADAAWAERVRPAAQRAWLGNRLAIVVRREQSKELDLQKVEGLALGGEGVPVGEYARAALENLGIGLPERVIYGANARDVLAKVAHGAAEAGIVYATDVEIEPAVRVSAHLPAEAHPPVVYMAALVSEDGRGLFEALGEKWALDHARAGGFEVKP